MQGCCGAARAAASGGPGIRRGGFSDQEDRLIVVHLQALLGNRWAAIASYLPDRTDNGVKNYWNTHVASLPPKGQRELKLPTDIDLLVFLFSSRCFFSQLAASFTESDCLCTNNQPVTKGGNV
jgi:hypothetical protein